MKLRVYPLSNNNQQVVNKTFDKIHCLGCLKFTTEYTLFSFLVFVICKANAEGKKKDKAMVDIRKLNEMVLFNSYALFLQSEIIANVQGCTNLAILNTASFFYQWRLYPDHCFMFIVIMHHGQKTFQVLIMGYINLVAYVQQKVDNILRNAYVRARAYMDDIICKAKSLLDLLKKLYILFNIFLEYNISIKPGKSFLNYPNIRLLGQKVNFLGLTTLEEKFKAINLLNYPKILSTLEYYLGLTGYLRNYIYYYAQLAALFQALKTSLLRDALISGQ